MKELVVLSLGGSLVAPNDIDVGFIRKFRQLILKNLSEKRFIIVVGGGNLARQYQKAAAAVGATDEEKDWLGVYATRINAYLLKTTLKGNACSEIHSNPTQKVDFKDILLASGWKPGFSTDHDAVLWAGSNGARVVINLTDIDHVYSKDPKRHKDAKPLKSLGWPEYRKIIGGKWQPGLKTPFDPVASREAEKSGIRVIILDGRNLSNLDSFLKGRDFKGTVIC